MTGATNPFGRRAAWWIAGLCAVSFVFGLVAVIFAEDLGDGGAASAEANSFSRSALGHRAFVDLLRELDVPVVVSQHASAARARDGALLVLEPGDANDLDRDRDGLRDLVYADAHVLLALPKWRGVPDPNRPGHWIARAEPLPTSHPDGLLGEVGLDARVVRTSAARVRCDAPRYGATVELPFPQLLEDRADQLEPLITCDGGLLAGLTWDDDGRRLLVLADPDLLATHGLGLADNAVAAVALVDALRDGGPVVLDETLHGFIRRPSFWRQLAEFPLALATLHGLLLLAVGLWAGLRRFGPALPPPPAIAPGKGFLIANTADLIEVAGHSRASLQRYWVATRAEVARALHAPAGLDAPALRAWLASLSGGRHAERLAAAEAAVDAATASDAPAGRRHLLRAARLVHAWKEDVLDGYRDRL